MPESKVDERTFEIVDEFDARVKEVGLPIARLELAHSMAMVEVGIQTLNKAIAETYGGGKMKIRLTLEFDSNDKYAREKMNTILENAEICKKPTALAEFVNARYALFNAICFCLQMRAAKLFGFEVVEDDA